MTDYLKPDKDGYFSGKLYHQGDCKLYRFKALSVTFYKESMGQGDSGSLTPPDEWIHSHPNSAMETVLKMVCEYLN